MSRWDAVRAPLVIPALLFLDAIVVVRDYRRDGALAFAALILVAIVAGRSRAHGVAVAGLLAGFAVGWWHGGVPQLDAEIPRATLAGIVTGDVAAQPWGSSFELDATGGARFAVALREPVEIGERLVVTGRLEPFDEPRNPEEPSARTLARERGIAGRLVDAHVVSRRSGDRYDPRTLPARCRAWASGTLQHLLGEPDATILAGMLFGARGALPRELRAEFQDTGTVHVLVTAGLHLGVVAATFAFLLARLGLGRIGSSLATIPAVWLYCALSGAHLPSLRAATMVTVALLARALGERAFSLNTIALAAIVVGALWPLSVGGASFALSFSCVVAIALFAEPIAEALEALHVPGVFREALSLTFATQLGVWPLTAAIFLVIAPYAPIANLLVVPVVGIALVGGIALLAATSVPFAAVPVARLESWPLAWIETAVRLTAGLPFAHVVATPPPLWAIAVYDLATVAAAIALRRSKPGPAPPRPTGACAAESCRSLGSPSAARPRCPK